jgi:outer membrane protein assembly factor BamE
MKKSVCSALRTALAGAAIGGTLIGLGACITPFRIEIQQGNYISREAMAQVKPGMTKEQVRSILGTPLLNDIFHADRWDYVFTRSAVNRTDVETRRATLLFKGDVLTSIDADLMPAESAKIVSENPAK